MAAHLRYIPKHYCSICGKKATVEAYNTYNSSMGYFCTPHGNAKVKQLQKNEI